MQKNLTDPTQLSHYAARLQSLKNDLSERRARIVRHHRDGVPADSEEQAGERQNDDVVASLGAHVDDEIALINAAMDRIDRGVFGICTGCGDAISHARLEALPYAWQCANCAKESSP